MQSLKDTQRSSRSELTHRKHFFYETAPWQKCRGVVFLLNEHNNNTEPSAAITGAKTSKAALDAIAEGHAKVIKK